MSWVGGSLSNANWNGSNGSGSDVGELYIDPTPPNIETNPSIGLQGRNEVPLPTSYKDMNVKNLYAENINGRGTDISKWSMYPAVSNVSANLNVLGVPEYDIENFRDMTLRNLTCVASGVPTPIGGNIESTTITSTIGHIDNIFTDDLSVNGPAVLDGGTTHGTTIGCLPVAGVNTTRVDVLPIGIDIASATYVEIAAGGAAGISAGGAATLSAGGIASIAGGDHIELNSATTKFINTSSGNDYTDVFVGNIHPASGGSAPLNINDDGSGRGIVLTTGKVVNSKIVQVPQWISPKWISTTLYSTGQQIQYTDNLYYNALTPNRNVRPTNPLSNWDSLTTYENGIITLYSSTWNGDLLYKYGQVVSRTSQYLMIWNTGLPATQGIHQDPTADILDFQVDNGYVIGDLVNWGGDGAGVYYSKNIFTSVDSPNIDTTHWVFVGAGLTTASFWTITTHIANAWYCITTNLGHIPDLSPAYWSVIPNVYSITDVWFQTPIIKNNSINDVEFPTTTDSTFMGIYKPEEAGLWITKRNVSDGSIIEKGQIYDSVINPPPFVPIAAGPLNMEGYDIQNVGTIFTNGINIGSSTTGQIELFADINGNNRSLKNFNVFEAVGAVGANATLDLKNTAGVSQLQVSTDEADNNSYIDASGTLNIDAGISISMNADLHMSNKQITQVGKIYTDLIGGNTAVNTTFQNDLSVGNHNITFCNAIDVDTINTNTASQLIIANDTNFSNTIITNVNEIAVNIIQANTGTAVGFANNIDMSGNSITDSIGLLNINANTTFNNHIIDGITELDTNSIASNNDVNIQLLNGIDLLNLNPIVGASSVQIVGSAAVGSTIATLSMVDNYAPSTGTLTYRDAGGFAFNKQVAADTFSANNLVLAPTGQFDLIQPYGVDGITMQNFLNVSTTNNGLPATLRLINTANNTALTLRNTDDHTQDATIETAGTLVINSGSNNITLNNNTYLNNNNISNVATLGVNTIDVNSGSSVGFIADLDMNGNNILNGNTTNTTNLQLPFLNVITGDSSGELQINNTTNFNGNNIVGLHELQTDSITSNTTGTINLGNTLNLTGEDITNVSTLHTNAIATSTLTYVALNNDLSAGGKNIYGLNEIDVDYIGRNASTQITMRDPVDLGTNYTIISGVKQPFIQFGVGNTGTGPTTITLPISYGDIHYVVQLTYSVSPSGNQPVYEIQSSRAVGSFQFHGANNNSISWTTFGYL